MRNHPTGFRPSVFWRDRTAALITYRTLSDVAGKAAFFAITVLAARRLSRDAFGIMSLGTTLGWMVAVATDFGMQMHLARAVAFWPDEARYLLETWLRVRLGSAVIGFVLLAVAVSATGVGAINALALVVFIAVYVVSGLIEFLHYFYRGLSRSDIESTLTLGWRGTSLLCAAAALWWRPDVILLAVALLVPACVTFAVSARRSRQLAPATDDGVSPGHAAVDVWSELRHEVWPIGAGIVLSAVYFRVDVLLIELWRGTEAVGLYNAVFRLVDALRLFPAAVLAVALPSLVRATSPASLVQVSAGLSGFAVGVVLVLWPLAGWLVTLVYGAAYAEAVPAFRVLLLSFPLMSLNYALTHQLIGWRRHRAYAAICGVALVFNLALNARLIRTLSIVGAAWATVGTELVVTFGCAAVLWHARSRQRTQPLGVGTAS
jgi:O-antigen/teichoic acid export membrane protein